MLLKLGWFAPLPPAKTGIADNAAGVMEALQKHADLRPWCNVAQIPPAPLPAMKFYDAHYPNWQRINDGDLNIYHVGNNATFHCGIWKIARQSPGVIILHDGNLDYLLAAFYDEYCGDPGGYRRQIEQHYGSLARHLTKAPGSDPVSREYLHSRFPITRAFFPDALGVVVHSRPAFAAMESLPCPVVHLPLPHTSSHPPARRRPDSAAPVQLIMFGHFGPNRGLHLVLEALHAHPRRREIRLDVYGELWLHNPIVGMIAALGLSEIVTLHGFVADAELDAALHRADLALNLRNPSVGEASASQLRIWNHALPGVVTRLGWYGDQPENAVLFVEPGEEVRGLTAILDTLLADRDCFRSVGENGRRHLLAVHGVESYARALLRFCEEAIAYRPRLAARTLMKRAAEELKPWLEHSSLTHELSHRLARQVEMICSPP